MTMLELQNRIIKMGNEMSMSKPDSKLSGFSVALDRKWKLGYLKALTDVLAMIEGKPNT